MLQRPELSTIIDWLEGLPELLDHHALASQDPGEVEPKAMGRRVSRCLESTWLDRDSSRERCIGILSLLCCGDYAAKGYTHGFDVRIENGDEERSLISLAESRSYTLGLAVGAIEENLAAPKWVSVSLIGLAGAGPDGSTYLGKNRPGWKTARMTTKSVILAVSKIQKTHSWVGM